MLAKIISTITSPFLIIPAFGLWIIGFFSYSLKEFSFLGLSFISLTILLPFIFIYIQKRRGKITDLHVTIKEQRAEPFLIATIGSLFLIEIYKLTNAPEIIFYLAILLTINGLVFYLITKFWKISIHTASFCGSVLIISILINPYFLFLLILLPLIIWSRTKREKHNFWQGIFAILIVSFIIIISFYFLKII